MRVTEAPHAVWYQNLNPGPAEGSEKGVEPVGKSISTAVCNPHGLFNGRTARIFVAAERRPIVVWNITRSCNLKYLHGCSGSEGKRYPGKLSTAEVCAVLIRKIPFGISILSDILVHCSINSYRV
jgi:hypothetical protein